MQLFVNDLTVIDFSYCCEQRGIVGESWIVDVLLEGELNEMSMVLDFGVVKKQIKAIIDEAVDHKLLLPMHSSMISVEKSTTQEDSEYVDVVSERGSYFLQSPTQAFAKLPTNKIDIASVTDFLLKIIKAELPDNVSGLTIVLREEVIDTDYYHYTHGLKLHDGNCQRIAHGHRSKIQLFKNDQRDFSLEKMWCDRWADIYIASEGDRIEKSDIQLSNSAQTQLTDKHEYFSYFAPQGRFDIAVPSNVLDVVDCDSTVELLADFICRQLKKSQPNDTIKVIAYEGVQKGAIAYD
ncbi:6-pyruvoyl trahydropterin synthase family protein [Pseudocolwellia sp. HL-MZ19]|uniref:6-pyruvoyl trahydropterin synthase family protein n=1 Tax=unclassified Pseudocolwellia TaxID=2848178 RepID=UPI003CEB1F30